MLLGDLNLDRLHPDKAEAGKLLIDLEETQGLEYLINKPTWVQQMRSRTTETLTDIILTNQPEMIIDSDVYLMIQD